MSYKHLRCCSSSLYNLRLNDSNGRNLYANDIKEGYNMLSVALSGDDNTINYKIQDPFSHKYNSYHVIHINKSCTINDKLFFVKKIHYSIIQIIQKFLKRETKNNLTIMYTPPPPKKKKHQPPAKAKMKHNHQLNEKKSISVCIIKKACPSEVAQDSGSSSSSASSS